MIIVGGDSVQTAEAINIRNVSTAKLVEELRLREGVKEVFVPPYERLEIIVNGIRNIESGPVTVFVIVD